MQHKFSCVNLIGRRWRTRETNQITPTYPKPIFSGAYFTDASSIASHTVVTLLEKM